MDSGHRDVGPLLKTRSAVSHAWGFLGAEWKRSPILRSCLEIDCLSKSCIQLNLELPHFFPGIGQLVLEYLDFLFYFCSRHGEHLLCLRHRDVEEGVANLVSNPASQYVSLPAELVM